MASTVPDELTALARAYSAAVREQEAARVDLHVAREAERVATERYNKAFPIADELRVALLEAAKALS